MATFSEFFAVEGAMEGMPLISEVGLATNDAGTLNKLRQYETEEIQLNRLPRTRGLTAKAMDGRTLETRTIQQDGIGRFENCLQLGRTEIRHFAPAQPFGAHAGKEILSYRRMWVQLTET